MDELARRLGLDPFALRRRNVVRARRADDAACRRRRRPGIGSYGLDQCLELVRARAGRRQRPPGARRGWLVGQRHGAGDDRHRPARRPFRRAPHDACCRRHVRPGGRHGGVRQRHDDRARADRRRACWARPRTRIRVRQSDTDLVGHDTGAYRSDRHRRRRRSDGAGAPGAARRILDAAPRSSACPADAPCGGRRRAGTLRIRSRRCRAELDRGAARIDGTPRSVAFNVAGLPGRRRPGTGEIRILRSVQAADAGKVINPMQCRGQVEGGVAQALGAALFEDARVGADGARRPRGPSAVPHPAFADVPRTEVLFADTSDALGPLGAKSMSESPFNPVAAAPWPTRCATRPASASPHAVLARPYPSGVAGGIGSGRSRLPQEAMAV